MFSSNIKWHNTKVTQADREKLNGHKGVCLWFTGLSGSGKSTLANELELRLNKRGIHTYLLDGDNVRHGLNKDLGFTDKCREENIRRIGEVAGLFVDSGIIVLSAFISPFHTDRDKVRFIVGEERFIEIFVDVKLEKCEERDPKGLYKKARAGEITDFTGINSPYEAPVNPELVLENNSPEDLEKGVESVIQYLINNKIIKAGG